jgi:hypothetical protein
MEAPAVHHSGAGHVGARGRCPVQAELVRPSGTSRKGRDITMLKKIMYSLGALAMLAMAVGAGFKPN